ncbi:MAG: MaoC family dehydratase [Bacilli bacterium]|nr:MaoC family dehydratase [Bacilli bacterium]
MAFEDFKLGMKAHTSKTITEADVILFAGVSTDINPVHLDEEVAKKGIFGKRVAHGILVSGLISAVLGNKLPGPGSIYMGQELKFLAPVFIGDTITAEVEIIELIPEKHRIRLATTCTNQDGKVVISGTALIMNRG